MGEAVCRKLWCGICQKGENCPVLGIFGVRLRREMPSEVVARGGLAELSKQTGRRITRLADHLAVHDERQERWKTAEGSQTQIRSHSLSKHQFLYLRPCSRLPGDLLQ